MSNQKGAEKPLVQVRPTFNVERQLLAMLVPFLIYMVFMLLIFAIIAENSVVNAVMFLIGAIIFVLIVIGFVAAMTKKQYSSCVYDFYKTKMEYTDEFISTITKEIKYDDISQIVLKSSLFEKIFNLGTIWLYTNEPSNLEGYIIIPSVLNVKDVYKDIKRIVNG